MKKIIIALLLCAIVILPSCNGNTDQPSDSQTSGQTAASTTAASSDTDAQTTAADTTSAAEEKTLQQITDAAVAAANFGEDGISLVYSDDEYAIDLLEFTYGVEIDLAEKLDSYVISEVQTLSAYSFAYFNFTEDATAEDITAVRDAISGYYVEELKSSLRTYDPEAYALCDEAYFKEYDSALLFVICEKENIDAVVAAVEG